MGSFTSPSPAVDGVLLIRLSHFHAREICVWTSLIQANTHSHSQTHTHTQAFIGLLIPWCVHSCQISVAVHLLCWAYVTEDQRQTACLFFSVSAVPVPPSHWAPLSHHWYNDYFSLPSLSLSLSLSLIRPTLSSTYRHTIKPQIARGFVCFASLQILTDWSRDCSVTKSHAVIYISNRYRCWLLVCLVDLCPGVHGIQVFNG